MRIGVKLQVAEPQRVPIAVGHLATHDRLQPRLELTHVVGLDEVVVGSGFQPVDAIVYRVARRQHQDRRPIANPSQPPAHLHPVDDRQAQVEHDRIGHGRPALSKPSSPSAASKTS